MFGILLLIVPVILLFIALRVFKTRTLYDELEGLIYTILVVCIIVGSLTVVVQFIDGVTDYPYLLKIKSKVETKKRDIELVRGATYTHKSNSGTLVNGSVENMNQSTVLSKYITETNDLKIDYNSRLVKIQYCMSNPMYHFICGGIYVSSRVLDLKAIE